MTNIPTLKDCELQILQGLKMAVASFVTMGQALAVIRDHKLYRTKGYSNFTNYHTKVWKFKKTHVNQLINAWETWDELRRGGHKILPENERVVRELNRVKPELRSSIWQEVQILAHPNSSITSQSVIDVINQQPDCLKPSRSKSKTPKVKDAVQEKPPILLLPQHEVEQSQWETTRSYLKNYGLELVEVELKDEHQGVVKMKGDISSLIHLVDIVEEKRGLEINSRFER